MSSTEPSANLCSCIKQHIRISECGRCGRLRYTDSIDKAALISENDALNKKLDKIHALAVTQWSAASADGWLKIMQHSDPGARVQTRTNQPENSVRVCLNNV